MNIHLGGEAVDELGEAHRQSVAVIGIGCRFPGAIHDARSYWTFLLEKKCGIIDIPSDRWNIDAFYDPNPDAPGKMRTRWGGFLSSDVFGFDPGFFDMSPREATSMDPQQRLALQIAFEAVQDAGRTLSDLQSVRTGVFVGISTNDFAQNLRRGRASAGDIFAGTGSAFSIAANRISHRFDLKGPSIAVDTACSSALVAIDQAVRHLSMGTCDMALAGGVNCMLDPGPFVAFSSANMLSPTGSIYTFDERADGFVRGEGCGLVLLKPLARAIADGDRIYGVIRHSMVNQDGYTPTLTAPNGKAQQAMLEALTQGASIDPADVDYVEAHGTGTPVGDPIEATAIGRVFGVNGRAKPLPVGSFKPNLGHLESASGIAGFIKALLTVAHGLVLPNRNFDRPNPSIPFDALNITVPVEPASIDHRARSGLAVVNSFGFGGTNGSVVIEGWRGPRPRFSRTVAPIDANHPVSIPLSAGSAKGLELWARRLADELGEQGSLADTPIPDIADQLSHGRDHFDQRAALIVERERSALRTQLCRLADAGIDQNSVGPTVITGRAVSRRLAMAFSGQGGQWWAMARRLLKEDHAFRRTADMFDEVLRPMVGWSTVEEMLRDEAKSRINDADVTQASIFATQIALYERWTKKGITPELLVGHSFGEVAATYVSGVIDIETAARIIAKRGLIPLKSKRRGAMATIGLTVDQLEPYLPSDGSVVIAAYNGPIAQTIAGMEEGVVAALAKVAEAYPDATARRMTMDFGWHSAHLEDCKEWFLSELGPVAWNEGNLPIISTVTGVFETKFDAEYWWANLRQPVSFTKALAFTLDYGINAFLEIGPHRTLTPLIRGIAQERGTDAIAINSLDRAADDFWTLARAEGHLYVSGVEPQRLQSAAGHAAVPQMPWNNQRLLNISEETKNFLFEAPRHPLLGWRDFTSGPSWTNEITLRAFKFLGDHRVSGDCLFPAVGYIEIMGAALRDHFGCPAVELRDFTLHEALSIAEDDVILLSTVFDPIAGKLRVSTLHRGSQEGWKTRAEAYGFGHHYELAPAPDDLLESRRGLTDRSEFYRLVDRHGLDYGPTFQSLEGLDIAGDRAIARLTVRDADIAQRYFAFPGLLDAVLQAGIGLSSRRDGLWIPGQPLPPEEDDKTAYKLRLPTGARKIMLKSAMTAEVVVDIQPSFEPDSMRFSVFSTDGRPLIVVDDLRTKSLGRVGGTRQASASGSSVFEEHFVRQEPRPASASPRCVRWLVMGNGSKSLEPTVADLVRRGATAEAADPALLLDLDAEKALASIQSFIAAAEGRSGILFNALISDSLDEMCDGTQLMAAITPAVHQLITLGKVFERMSTSAGAKPELVVVTSASRIVEDDAPMPIQGLCESALIGVARTMANECKGFSIRLIDADAVALSSATAVCDVLLEDTAETEFVLRGAQRYVPRLDQLALRDLAPSSRKIETAGDAANFAVTMTRPGTIDNVVLRETIEPTLGPDEALVEIAAVGLNFRDIMAATGILPDELENDDAYWRNLGLEFSGTVRRVGPGVSNLRPGDRIMGMGKGYLRRFAKVRADYVMRVPDRLELVEAATLPTAFLTAHYALNHVARLARGETALIHLASGGVGLAAVQVARDRGAKLFGTAGSEQKRAFLSALDLDKVMNSRSLDFADEVRAATQGRGVDVVLNALSGSGIDKSLECLAPFGRMIEIGKRDLAEDKPIGLRSLYRNNAYSVIDLSTLPIEKPDLFRQLLREVEAKIAAGTYKPLKATRFPASSVAEAMRMLSRAQHIGKVVVTFDESVIDVELDLQREFELSARGSYLVTGGLKGFGVAVADWLSRSGGGTLILANRSGVPDAEASDAIKLMEQRGTRIVCTKLDVSDATAVDKLIGQYASGENRLRGIVHGAAVIEDAFISQLDADKIDRVLRPKIAGGWNLHVSSLKHGIDLDFLANFSSIAQVIGSVGQANYTAANSVLNAIASYRRGRGMSGSSAAWGMIAGSGFVARSEAMTNYLDSVGIKPVQDTEAASALAYLLRAKSENLGFANLDWTAVARANTAAASNPRISHLLGERAGGRSRIQAELAAAPREAWTELLGEMIRREVAKVLKVDASALADDRKLSELGLDSLSSFELKNRVEAQVEVDIPVAKFLQAPTIAGLSTLVASAFEAKLRVSLQLSTTHSSTVAAVTQDAFHPFGRQVHALRLDTMPMSSSVAKANNQIVLVAKASSGILPEALSARLARLADNYDSLRMRGSLSASGEVEITFDAEPVLELLPTGVRLGKIELPGPLWRFGVSPGPDGRYELQVRAHRAAADTVSVHLILSRLVQPGGAVGEKSRSFAQYARSKPVAPGSPGHRRDVAYWKEILHDAPAIASIPGRRRAAAPTGMGSNRGEVGILEATFSISPHAVLSPSRGVFAAAYAKALAGHFSVEALILDNHFSEREDLAADDLIGPLEGSYPIVLRTSDRARPDILQQIERADANGRAHRHMDVASIELAFEQDLRLGKVALRQFGFALIEDSLSGSIEELGFEAVAVGAHEIQLVVLVRNSNVRLQLRVDFDVLDEIAARRLVDAYVRELGAQFGSSAYVKLEDTRWKRSNWSGEHQPAMQVKRSPRDGVANVEREIAVTSTQSALLWFQEHPDATPLARIAFTVSKELKIRPQMDVDRLKKAIEAVMARHEVMRTRFFQKGAGYGAYLERRPTDFFSVEHAADETEAMRRASELAQESIDIRAPMFRITLIRFGDESDIIIAKGHHLVLDGYSLGLILEESIKAYLGLPLDPVQINIDQFVRDFDHVGRPGSFERRDVFLRKLFAEPLPEIPNLGRKAKGHRPNVDLVDCSLGAEVSLSIPGHQQEILRKRAKDAGTTEVAMVIAAFAQMIAARGGVDDMILQVPSALRHDRRLENYVNFVASDLPVRARPLAFETLEALAAAIGDQIVEATQFAPFMDSNYLGELHDEVVGKGSYTALFVVGSRTVDKWTRGTQSAPLQRSNVTGELDLGMFKVTPLPDMRKERPCISEMDFRSFPTEDGLGLALTFDTMGYDHAEAEDILREVAERLLAGQSAAEPVEQAAV
ncbi:MAG: SDR family NAD(P)-dependent oxidoreductase [Mesorhizobium sp.]|uniref:type I polyketide synthase n=1 Tax=Mesorhizobium sp. TaxID=1871066 RepID=UPI000FE84F39|nr:type I polyketide synthase [Mesorhizobium sp.]RWL88757.1 MAG: SDR family NAD(P)-dependent oxidoreductase [Mesorhizobium sp.]